MLAKPQGFPRKLGGCAGLDPRLRSAVSAGVGDGERGLRRGLRAPGVGVRPKWVLEYSPSNKRIRYFVSITYVRTGLWTAHKFCGGGEVSSRFPGRAYHINDSGDTARFFLSDLAGGLVQTVTIEGFEPRDTEDMTLGDCGPDRSCLFIADFGDNNAVREEVRIVIIEELETFGASVEPLDIVRFQYPGGPTDAESIAIHPSGDLVIITKEVDFSARSAHPSRVFKLSKDQWQNANGAMQTATLVGTLDFAALTTDPFSGRVPTAMDIASDGSRFLVLSYVDAYEFYFDLLDGELKPTAEMVSGVDYREIDIELLEQQEAVAYLPGSDAFLYDTEFVTQRAVAGPPVAGRARVMRVDCPVR